MSRIEFYERALEEIEDKIFDFNYRDPSSYKIEDENDARSIINHDYYRGSDGKIDFGRKQFRNECVNYLNAIGSLSYEVNTEHISPVVQER